MKHILSVAAALAFVSTGAMAQGAAGPTTSHAAASPVAADVVGHWIYDQQGNKLGSVRGLADGGRTAVIMVGSYFQPGSHEARISAGALSVVDGNVTLRNETVQALNTVPRR